MLKPFTADLHVHTLLSPCAEIEMTPRNIIRHARQYGIDIIAVTDHNAGDNAQAMFDAARKTDIHILPGMEVETKEEIHVLILFDELKDAAVWQKYVQAHLPDVKNNDSKFGAQFIVDHEDNLISIKEQMLLMPTDVSLEEMTAAAEEYGGLIIASHIDRPSYSILSQLGFVPEGVVLHAVELSKTAKFDNIPAYYPSIMKYPIITSSDAHTIDDFLRGPKTVFFIEQPSVAEIKLALCGQRGRRVIYNYYLP